MTLQNILNAKVFTNNDDEQFKCSTIKMTLCYLFLTSTLQKKKKEKEIYPFKQLQFYDKGTEKSNYEQNKIKKSVLKNYK